MVKESLKNQILEIIFQWLDSEKITVFMFGSQVQNKRVTRSDIDIGILCDGGIEDSKFVNLDECLNRDVNTLRKIDLVDFSRVDKEFRQFAMKDIEIWHSAKNFKEK